MARDDERGPRHVSWSLERLAKGVKRIDLAGFAAVESAWPSVPAALACAATPVRLARHELVIAVPTGAHAARARRDAASILRELATQLEDPPTSLRVTVASS